MIVISDDDEEEEEQDYAEASTRKSYYFVQVFPSEEVGSIEIRQDAKKKDQVVLKRSTLLRYARTELAGIAGQELELPNGVEYQVRVIRDRALNRSNQSVALEKMVELQSYATYLNKNL